jgi:hypothetical protein
MTEEQVHNADETVQENYKQDDEVTSSVVNEPSSQTSGTDVENVVSTQVQKVTEAIPVQIKEKLHRHSFPLAFFIVIQVMFIMIHFFEFSVITVAGRIIQLQLFVFVLYQICSRVWFNSTHFKFPYSFKASTHLFEPISVIIEDIIRSLEDYVLVKKPLKTLGFILIIQIVCMFGKHISGFTFIYLVMNWFIISPIVYKYNQVLIDSIFKQVQTKIYEILQLISAKVPPGTLESFNSFIKKLE